MHLEESATRYGHLPDDKVRKPDIVFGDEEPEEKEEEKDLLEEEDSAEEKRSARKKGHMRFSFKMGLWIAFMVLVCTIALLFCFYPGFQIQNIEVSGNNKVSTQEILSIVDIHKDEHLMSHVGGSLKSIVSLHYGALEQKLMDQEPYIRDVQIVPSFPGNVYINITERQKVAYAALPDGYAVISDDGAVLEICHGDVPKGIPELRGLPIRSAQIGKKLDMTSSEGYEISITILGAILSADSLQRTEGDTFDFLSHVVCVRYCENMTTFIDIEVPNYPTTITVKVGSMKTISDNMNWLRFAIVSGYFDGKTGELLDMTGNNYILR